jgi:hydrogenase maturation protein HypF
MPGGALAVRKPYRMALGYLLAAEPFEQEVSTVAEGSPGGAGWIDPELTRAFLDRLDPREVEVVRVQLARGLNAPIASSAGRLFDAAAALLGIRDVAEYEAQAAVELELLAEQRSDGIAPKIEPLPYAMVRADGPRDGSSLLIYDPRPTIRGLLEGSADGATTEGLAARFQETIAAVTREFCAEVRAETGLTAVVLSGGVFQNQWLATTLVRRLSGDGFEVHTNRQVPANDGGISYGQTAVAAARLAAAS